MKKINLYRVFGLTKGKNTLFLVGLLVFWWAFLVQAQVGISDVFHDRDQDGLSDEEEYMYGTDPSNPDSDGDGYRDGVEVEAGFDPLKPAPGDKISFQIEKTENEIGRVEENVTEDFFNKLEENKGEELDLLAEYYANPEKFESGEGFEELNSLSLTSQDLQNFVNQSVDLSNDMELISEDQVIVLDKPTGSEKKVFKKEKEQIEKYLTQIFYIMSVNKPFAIENQALLPQLGVSYVGEINKAVQLGQTKELSDLKEKAQKTYEEALKVETPEVTKDIHIQTLSIIKYLIESVDEKKLVDQNDPMAMALYVGKLQAALIEGENLKSEIDEIVEEYEIDIFQTELAGGIF